MWSGYRYQILIFVLVYNRCESVSNVDFNEQLRDYSAVNDNITNAKTLQIESMGISRYADIAPLHKTIRFKDVPDNVLSGSSHGRGLHHDHSAGYGLFEYENPHYDPGYEYQLAHHNPHDHHEYPHEYHHYDVHDPHHHEGHHVTGYGHHHKHYDHHALAAKTILWPIAGIALLGAAAALVSNPVLLQLGVVSGRKKRQVESLDVVKDSIKKWDSKLVNNQTPGIDVAKDSIKKWDLKQGNNQTPGIVKGRINRSNSLNGKKDESDNVEHKSNFKMLTVLSRRFTDADEERMIPVPLIFQP